MQKFKLNHNIVKYWYLKVLSLSSMMPSLFNEELDSILLAWLNLSTENSNLRPIYRPAFAFFGIEEITEKQCATRYSSLVRGFNSRYGKDTNAARLTAETLRKEGSLVLKLAPAMEELICEKMERLKELYRQNLPPHLIGTKRARSTAQKRTINQVEEQKSSLISAKRRAKPASPQLAVVIKTGPDSANRRLIELGKTIRIMAVQLQQKDVEIQKKAQDYQLAKREISRLNGLCDTQSTRISTMELTLVKAQPTNDVHHDPLSHLGFRYIMDIADILQQGERKTKLAGLVYKYARQPQLLDLSIVNETIQVFARELGSLLPDDIHCDSLLQPHEMENTQPSLMILFNHILGECEDDDKRLTELYHRWIHRVEPEALIQSLIMAAVKGWVFETDCSIFSGPKEKPLLSKYQEIVEDCSGWDELRNLDIAAHYCLMETKDFRENVILHKASMLACNLSKILAPLFIDPLDETASIDLESWGHSSGTVEERKFRLETVFEKALDLKARTLLTDNELFFEMQAPGITINGVDPLSCRFLATLKIYDYPGRVRSVIGGTPEDVLSKSRQGGNVREKEIRIVVHRDDQSSSSRADCGCSTEKLPGNEGESGDGGDERESGNEQISGDDRLHSCKRCGKVCQTLSGLKLHINRSQCGKAIAAQATEPATTRPSAGSVIQPQYQTDITSESSLSTISDSGSDKEAWVSNPPVTIRSVRPEGQNEGCLSCPKCGIVVTRGSFWSHKKTCVKCSQKGCDVWGVPMKLRNHKKTHDPKAERFICDRCGVELAAQESLINHKNKGICRQCPKCHKWVAHEPGRKKGRGLELHLQNCQGTIQQAGLTPQSMETQVLPAPPWSPVSSRSEPSVVVGDAEVSSAQ